MRQCLISQFPGDADPMMLQGAHAAGGAVAKTKDDRAAYDPTADI